VPLSTPSFRAQRNAVERSREISPPHAQHNTRHKTASSITCFALDPKEEYNRITRLSSAPDHAAAA
jgi:hypothetical protein